MTIKILVADDHGIVRTLLDMLCRSTEGFTIVADAHDGETAIKRALATRPDVALIDIKLPGISGIEVTRRLNRALPETKVIILTALEGAEFAASALAAGAMAYLTKNAVSHELVRTIRNVHEGRCHIDASLAQRVAMAALRREDALADRLTHREIDVLFHLLRGHTAAEISQALSLAPKTVEHHRRAIRRKLQVTTDAQLGVVAARYELDPPLDETG